MQEDERRILAGWLDGFERCFGQPVILEPHLPSLTRLGPLQRLRFPPVFGETALIGTIGPFGQSKALLAHLRALGFDWGDDGVIGAAPSPATFNTLLELATDGQAGYPLVFHHEDSVFTSTGPWLHRYLEGRLPIHVASAAFYAATPTSPDLRWQLTTLAHDLTVHALNYHLIPRSELGELGRRIRAAVGPRVAGLDRLDAVAPVTLSWFFDNDLNRYCYEVWFKCQRPEHFGPTFSAKGNLAQLHAALDVRLEETLAGRGDVATGRAEDIAPLQAVSFELRAP